MLRRLKAARLEAGMTQMGVAKALRLPQSQISREETGERKLTPVELARLAKLYRKKLEWFIPD